jgi:hypothetical protein
MGHQQNAEKAALLTRPALARQDAPIPMHRSRIVQILNVLIRFSDVGSAGGGFPFAKIY